MQQAGLVKVALCQKMNDCCTLKGVKGYIYVTFTEAMRVCFSAVFVGVKSTTESLAKVRAKLPFKSRS